MDRESIFKSIEKKMIEYESYINAPNFNPNDDQEVKVMKHYFYLNEMLTLLISELGSIGKALQGEDELTEGLLNVASICANWLENMNKPLL